MNTLSVSSQVSIAAVMNVVASIVSIVGIAFYAIDLGDKSISSLCSNSSDDNCRYVAQFFKVSLRLQDRAAPYCFSTPSLDRDEYVFLKVWHENS